jgi:hypothetical protein
MCLDTSVSKMEEGPDQAPPKEDREGSMEVNCRG